MVPPEACPGVEESVATDWASDPEECRDIPEGDFSSGTDAWLAEPRESLSGFPSLVA